MNLKAFGLFSTLALLLSPIATPAQTATAPAKAAPRMQTTFSTPLKIVGADGHFTVTPRGSNTTWSCSEGTPTEIDAGNPPQVVYSLSADGTVLVANANGGALKLDVTKSQYATAATADALDAAPMHDFATLGAKPTLIGTSPNSVNTGFSLLYSATSGLSASVMTGTQTLGVFTIAGNKWQIGIFPLDDAQSAADAAGATPMPKARGDVIVIGGGCKGSPVPDTSIAK